MLPPSTVSITPVGLNPAVRVWMRRGCGAERVWTSAPSPTSVSTTSGCCWATAHISAVWPRVCSRAFRSAPWDAKRRTASADPVRDAVISTVSPEGSAVFASAPAASRAATIASLPLRQASQSGVVPKSFAASTSAPGPEEGVRHDRVVPVGGPVQGGRAVRLTGIRGNALLEQRDGSRRVRRPGGVEQPHALGRGAARDGQQQRSQERRPGQTFRMHDLLLHRAVSTGPETPSCLECTGAESSPDIVP